MPRSMNVLQRTGIPIGEIRCPSCNKLLAKEVGTSLAYSIELKCPRCRDITLAMREPKERK